MKILIIDTSTERGIIACVEDGAPLFSMELPFGLLNSQFLLPGLDEALKKANVNVKPLDFIIAGVGPGSYTGIRVGATAAKTLSFAMKIPLVGVCSLQGFIPTVPGKFAAVIDAKIGGIYFQKGELSPPKGVVIWDSEPQIVPLEEAAKLLSQTPKILTPNAILLRPKLEQFLPNAPWTWEENYPSPSQLAILGLDKFNTGEYSTDGHLELLYMRKTQAEIERDLKHRSDSP